MFKKLFPITLIIGMTSLGYATDAAAVDTFFQSPPTTTGTSADVLSPADFAKQVSDANQKQQAAAMQQLNQQLSQVPKPTTPPPSQPTSATPGSQQPNAPEQSTQQSTTTEETEQPTENSYTQPTQTRVPPPPPPVTPQPIPTAQPTQVYTGFGGGQTTTPVGPSKGTNSGGWNIKY